MRNKKIFRVTIVRPNGEELDVTRYVPYPVEWRDSLDETYDEAVVELKYTKLSEPFTFGDVAVVKVGKKEQRYVISKDDVTTLYAIKMWNHSIRLCEETAVLERYPASGGKCFTQPLVKNYEGVPARVDLTVYDAGKRLCETSEAIVEGEKPRFTFSRYSSDGAVDYATVKCPEISVGNNRMLWEAFCELGHYVHAIPRLYAGGVIKFDRLGRTDKAVLPYRPIQEFVSASGERYCTGVDTIAQNLVPSAETVPTYAPLPHMWMTVRSESGEVRITDTNAMIVTQYPIYKVLQVWAVGVKDKNGAVHADIDITRFVFEEAEYRTLASYSEADGTFVKTCAIYYSEGSPNIKGLSFKEQNAISQAFSDYTIYNILSQATSSSVDMTTAYFTELAFRVKYVPIVSARVKASKSDKESHATEYLLPYNQTSDRPSVAALSENIRGTLKQYNAAEKKVSYLYPNIDKLPEVGQKFDDAYYINDMTVSLRNHQYAIATLGLSKHYNALGKGMSLPTQLRQYEISEKNVQDRYVVVEEYVLVSNDVDALAKYPAARFVKNYTMYQPLDGLKYRYLGVNSVTYDEERNVIASTMLPVIGMPIANSAVFAWRYEDNYSAGAMSLNPETETAEHVEEEGLGWWQELLDGIGIVVREDADLYRLQRDLRYGDVYGEAHSMGFALYVLAERQDGDKCTREKAAPIGNALPAALEGSIPKAADTVVVQTSTKIRTSITKATATETEKAFKDSLAPVVLHKDSRETICCTYQLNYVGDGIVIGAGMAKITLGIRNDTYEREFTIRLYENAAIDEVSGIAPRANGIATYKPIFVGIGSDAVGYDLKLYVNEELPEHAAWALRDNYGNFIMGANKPFAPVYYRAVASLEERERILGAAPYYESTDSLVNGKGIELHNNEDSSVAVHFYAPFPAVYHLKPQFGEGAYPNTNKQYMHMKNIDGDTYQSTTYDTDAGFFCLPMKEGVNKLKLWTTSSGTYTVEDFAVERKSAKASHVFMGKKSITFVECSGEVASGTRGSLVDGCFHLRGQTNGKGEGSDAITVDVSGVPEGRYKIGLCASFSGTINVNGSFVKASRTVASSSGVEYIDTGVLLFRERQDKIRISLNAPDTTHANIGAVVLHKIE